MEEVLTVVSVVLAAIAAGAGAVWGVLAWEEHRNSNEALPPHLREVLKKGRYE